MLVVRAIDLGLFLFHFPEEHKGYHWHPSKKDRLAGWLVTIFSWFMNTDLYEKSRPA